MPPKDKKYTDPKLREEVKEEIQQGDKGGAPGQWSARKAQMMAKEYKARGGDYTTPKEDKDESQKHLTKWTEEEWQTKDGSAHAKQEDGTRKRYLPKKAWEEMNEEEKEETEKKKQEGSKEGHQFVQNTPRAKSARKNAHEAEDQEHEQKKTDKRTTRSSTKKGEDKNEKEEQKETDGMTADEKKDEQPGQKRSRTKSNKADDEEDSKKKQKSNPGAASSKSNKSTDDTPAAEGSSSRLPKKGQNVHWKSPQGFTDGTVVEVLKAGKEVDGKQVKASKDDPRIVVKSSKSGKIAVHKADSVYFD
ncbi:hypothetical protein LTR10_021920 [Elasticomyces elasticus]|uniref:Hypervirulence associated protein TUDOR domain-containing protein n=1 Tax=Exophiala sideris TaxID=1016849 RepID=A0ABR0IX87_9EURO|nr:hypothetical protein LTR10_021920 [Elasticomyces elasticus]KAK5021848.1 hypothetical protein LTS07_010589 [Exophiala sideris]KAK5025913.1 hypothetical protein LTR13_010226 [Exophiala sideris]KAK5050278.1 hypothetical protein LTR69_010613 [Exophiala sideris]KAK5177117.1 hypothetical protein LTR44_010401 [Eurotiomycetes sp. CCFEE 6388]